MTSALFALLGLEGFRLWGNSLPAVVPVAHAVPEGEDRCECFCNVTCVYEREAEKGFRPGAWIALVCGILGLLGGLLASRCCSVKAWVAGAGEARVVAGREFVRGKGFRGAALTIRDD